MPYRLMLMAKRAYKSSKPFEYGLKQKRLILHFLSEERRLRNTLGVLGSNTSNNIYIIYLISYYMVTCKCHVFLLKNV